MSYETLIVSRENAVCTITINRPKVLNALSAQVFADLTTIFEELAVDDSIRVVVLTGAGDRSFVAGADISEFVDMTPDEAEVRTWKGMHVYDRMRRLPQPIVAKINGYALGGGLLIAIACDVRVAADSAQFGYPEIKLGIFPGTGGTVLLDRLIGAAAARALCLTGDRLSAERAYQLGIVTHLAPAAELESKTQEVVSTLASYSPVALRELKCALNASLERDFESARAEEVKAYKRCFASKDRLEGARAFLEKRAPNFIGQ